jgi:hypothetical protein
MHARFGNTINDVYVTILLIIPFGYLVLNACFHLVSPQGENTTIKNGTGDVSGVDHVTYSLVAMAMSALVSLFV